MATFTSLDLSKLAPPDLIKAVDFATILAAIKLDLQDIINKQGKLEIDVAALPESEPISKLLKVLAYRELGLRQRINEAAKQCMLATASGTNLDQVAALFGVERLELDPGDPDASPPTDPTFETDDELRRRAQSAFESFASAGPRSAYEFHAQTVQYECTGTKCTTAIVDEALTFDSDTVSLLNPDVLNVVVTKLVMNEAQTFIDDGTTITLTLNNTTAVSNIVIRSSDGQTKYKEHTDYSVSNGIVTAQNPDLTDNVTVLISYLVTYKESTDGTPADYTLDVDAGAVTRATAGGIVSGDTVLISYDAYATSENEEILESVKDVTVNSPEPGDVEVTILSAQGNGRPSDGLITAVGQALNEEDIRPITDKVKVKKAVIKLYEIEAELIVDPALNSDFNGIQQAAEARAKQYIADRHRLDRDITVSTLYAALSVQQVEQTDDNSQANICLQTIPGLQTVNLISPAEDIEIAYNEAPFCDPDDEEAPRIRISVAEPTQTR